MALVRAVMVLTLNSGSSSLKWGVHHIDALHCETLFASCVAAADNNRPFDDIATHIVDNRLPAVAAIGHRLVHGGPTLRQPCRIDDAVLLRLDEASHFAPLHLPCALQLIRASRQHFQDLPQVACFDTSFHAHLPDVARALPLARELQFDGVQRYGFHGLSCQSIVHQLGADLPERVVIAHLGNGASITAVRNGLSIDTSMGLTPMGGVVMGTRSGDLDPGVLLYLMRVGQLDVGALEALLNQRSGLLGVSGVSGDLRQLHAAAGTNAAAVLAIQMFCQSVFKQIAAMIAVLDGLDLLIFTGGIGENDAAVRAAICRGLGWIGIQLDPLRNHAAGSALPGTIIGPIHASASRCQVRVLAAQEDAQIARLTWAVLHNPAAIAS